MVNPLGLILGQAQQAELMGKVAGQVGTAVSASYSAVAGAGRGAAHMSQMMSTMADPKTVRATKTNIKMFQGIRKARGAIMMVIGLLDKFIILQPVFALLGAMFSLIGAGMMEELMPYLQQWAEWLSDPETQEGLKNVGRAIGSFIALILDFEIAVGKAGWGVEGGIESLEAYGEALNSVQNPFYYLIQLLKLFGIGIEDLFGIIAENLHLIDVSSNTTSMSMINLGSTMNLASMNTMSLNSNMVSLDSGILDLSSSTLNLNNNMVDLSDVIDESAIPELNDLIDTINSIQAPDWGGDGDGDGDGIPWDPWHIFSAQEGAIFNKPSLTTIAEKEPEVAMPISKLNWMFSDIRAGNEKLLMEINRLRQSVEAQGDWDW